MNRHSPPPHLDNDEPVVVPHDPSGVVEVKATEDVRQGARGGHVWQILLLSFAGAAIAMGGAYLLFIR